MRHLQAALINVSLLLWAAALGSVAAASQVVWSEEAEKSARPSGMRFGTAVADDDTVWARMPLVGRSDACWAAGALNLHASHQRAPGFYVQKTIASFVQTTGAKYSRVETSAAECSESHIGPSSNDTAVLNHRTPCYL